MASLTASDAASSGPNWPESASRERVGPAARYVPLIPGRAEAGAHDARLQGPAGAVVVAHLRRTQESAPGGPIQAGFDFGAGRILRLEAQQAAVVHFGWADDIARD